MALTPGNSQIVAREDPVKRPAGRLIVVMEGPIERDQAERSGVDQDQGDENVSWRALASSKVARILPVRRPVRYS